MRILLVNPNMTKAMTDRMAGIARAVLPEGMDLVPLTAERGFPYIASRAEAQVGGAVAYEMIAAHAETADAAILAAFGDPGLAGARELFDFPVVGMAEASLLTAAMLGERFSIVTFSPVMQRWYVDSVRDAGLTSRFTGVRTPAAHSADVGAVRETLRADLIELCNAAVQEDGADVVILGGAPLAGLAHEIEEDVAGVVVDPVSAAAAQAVALLTLTRPAAFARRHSKPIAKASKGLAPALSRSFARETAG
ncbi:aspartate/glutamate racemase family protein [Jannaschia seohaensis]|uniref:Asp/Glu/hydantoin racemase n=1 Tax=Jannaschia seohaensis TaxID=475081 RepID=A0A2Y9AJ72_9RHOB|nr:aspartate/glutamate racemase family protein [Jannaschia seohaensis]PWJ20206.1 Asp/Glu/hydantoin racemase [Jannaschia seohaensis]SSA44195.1 Asp/Glu/hydantoin racemase [Jannaschia seohaensis]